VVNQIQVIDSHTGGEPTRTVIAGGPDLGTGSLTERREIFRDRFDDFRSCVINEPRGSDVLVGAILTESTDDNCVAGVIFFNNVGVLHMCGHGTIGVAETLAHLGRIEVGTHLLETSVGPVAFEYHGENRVTIENVPCYRSQKSVKLEVPDVGTVTGDIAWGGNWFFLVSDHGETLSLDNTDRLTEVSWKIRHALETHQITGEDGGEIDHIELFGPPQTAEGNSRSFVLCPGGAYDRSPCGTGTSAKVACLAADGKLLPGEIWRQESIIGSIFEASYTQSDQNRVVPKITGSAYVTAEATLIADPKDPFQAGIRR
jgi:4-hydroxyproline epimerase